MQQSSFGRICFCIGFLLVFSKSTHAELIYLPHHGALQEVITFTPQYLFIEDEPNRSTSVDFTALTGVVTNGAVLLKWTTSSEINNYGFEIDRSNDASRWISVGFVSGQGTVTVAKHYSFYDKLVAHEADHPVLYYRLRQIDGDGTVHFSTYIQINTREDSWSAILQQNYPNPFNVSTNIAFFLPHDDLVTLTVYNAAGDMVARIYYQQALEAGNYVVPFTADFLPGGYYTYQLQTSISSSSRTMILGK